MDTSEECQKKEYPEEFGNGVHLGEEDWRKKTGITGMSGEEK